MKKITWLTLFFTLFTSIVFAEKTGVEVKKKAGISAKIYKKILVDKNGKKIKIYYNPSNILPPPSKEHFTKLQNGEYVFKFKKEHDATSCHSTCTSELRKMNISYHRSLMGSKNGAAIRIGMNDIMGECFQQCVCSINNRLPSSQKVASIKKPWRYTCAQRMLNKIRNIIYDTPQKSVLVKSRPNIKSLSDSIAKIKKAVKP